MPLTPSAANIILPDLLFRCNLWKKFEAPVEVTPPVWMFIGDVCVELPSWYIFNPLLPNIIVVDSPVAVTLIPK